MLTPMMGNRLPDGRTFAVDTGCFARPDKYSDGWYLAYLRKLAHARDRCLFATAPDVLGDGPATLAKSLPMLPRIRAEGYRAALVVQPGIALSAIPWDELDAIFVGGPDWWHRSGTVISILAEAKRRGKWLHEGRVNTERGFKAARVTGYDSADGTFLAFGPDVNLIRLQTWIDGVRDQPTLFRMIEQE